MIYVTMRRTVAEEETDVCSGPIANQGANQRNYLSNTDADRSVCQVGVME